MSNKELVLKYSDEWVGKGVNPENGMAVRLEDVGYDFMQAYAFFDSDGTRITAILTHSDDCHMWEIIARILKLDNPWRVTAEELPDNGREILGAWGDGLNPCKAIAFYKGGHWLDLDYVWDGDEEPDDYYTNTPPDRWMYVPPTQAPE